MTDPRDDQHPAKQVAWVPSPRLVLIVATAVLLVAGIGFGVFHDRQPDGAGPSSGAAALSPEAARLAALGLDELCSGRPMADVSTAETAPAHAFHAAIAHAAGRLNASTFDDKLTDCAARLHEAGGNGTISSAASHAALMSLAEVCARLRGSQSACAAVDALQQTAIEQDTAGTARPETEEPLQEKE